MAIFDKAPVPAKVFPAVPVDDGYGGTKPGEGTPVDIHVFAQPMTTDSATIGWVSPRRMKILAASLPAGTWSRVEMLGRVWTVETPPLRHGPTARTTYATATVIEKGSDGNG